MLPLTYFFRKCRNIKIRLMSHILEDTLTETKKIINLFITNTNIEYTKFNAIIWLQIKKLPFSHFIPWVSLGINNIKTKLFARFFQFLQVHRSMFWGLNDLMPWKNPKINVMIEEHIYHFFTGLSFSFFLPILLLLSPGYCHSHSPRKKNE